MQEESVRREESSVENLPSGRGTKIAVALLAVGLCGVLIYASMQQHSAKELAARVNELSVALNRENGQVETLTQKLIAAESTPAPTPQPLLNAETEAQVPVAIPKPVVHYHSKRHTSMAKARPAEDPWREQIQSELTEQQKLIAEHQHQIEETQQSVEKTRTEFEGTLQSTRDDLNGSIAKNHAELVALEKKGERNFYEFNLHKSKQFQKTGSMSISLRKSNSKHAYCDLVMIVNDSEVSKKHVNLYEPVLFYPEGFSQPLQVVINNIGNDAARGYVSEPKYKSSELAATESTSASEGQAAHSSSTDTATLKHRAESR